MEHSFRAAVFDLDGTLLDTLQDLGACADEALRQYGFPGHTMEEYRSYIGNGIPRLIARAVPEGTSEQDIQKVLNFYLGYYPVHCAEHTKLFPGVAQTIRLLRQRGYALAVLSNKTETTAKKIIAEYFPDEPVCLVWGNNGVRPLKPATDAGYSLLQELTCRPEEVFYLGDGDTDMAFASRMGFFAAGATWGYRPEQALLEAGADRLFSSMQEILPYLP